MKQIINYLEKCMENLDRRIKRDDAIGNLVEEIRINLVNMFADKNSSLSKELNKRINGKIINVRINIKNLNLKAKSKGR